MNPRQKTAPRAQPGLAAIEEGPRLKLIDVALHENRTARGVIAIGRRAVGVFAFGGLSCGVVALGGLALGVFTFGGISVGIGAALGGIAVGGYAIGGLAAGHMAQGGMALGTYACGGGAAGKHALDPRVMWDGPLTAETLAALRAAPMPACEPLLDSVAAVRGIDPELVPAAGMKEGMSGLSERIRGELHESMQGVPRTSPEAATASSLQIDILRQQRDAWLQAESDLRKQLEALPPETRQAQESALSSIERTRMQAEERLRAAEAAAAAGPAPD